MARGRGERALLGLDAVIHLTDEQSLSARAEGLAPRLPLVDEAIRALLELAELVDRVDGRRAVIATKLGSVRVRRQMPSAVPRYADMSAFE